ncbi:MAG: ABC transporter permease [Acidobacteria bacterium]|nr:ABC transporter permease [Acidobacteriota bacterium]
MGLYEKLRNTLRPNALNRELEEELRHHMEMKALDCERWGMTEEQARAEARRVFGSHTLHKEATRDMDVTIWLDAATRDLKYAARQLWQSPLFTLVAVLTLSIGMGANSAIFSLLHTLLLKDLNVPSPERLVLLTAPEAAGVNNGSSDGVRALLSYAEFAQLRSSVRSFDSMFASESGTTLVMVSFDGKPAEPFRERLVGGDFFIMLGALPAAGRFFTASEERGPGSMPFAVLNYNLWKNRFGGRPEVVGATVRIQGRSFTIVGVAPPGFQGENTGGQPDLWLPLMMQPQLMAGRDWLRDEPSRMPAKLMWLHSFGRLKQGVTMAQAQAEVNAVFKSLLEQDYRGLSAESRKQLLTQYLQLRPGRKGVSEIRRDASRLLAILLSISASVLLIACANLANLLLARSSSRRREISVRLALGAGRGTLIRQMLTESLLLALMGAAGGLLVMAITRGVMAKMLVSNSTPELGNLLDPAVLGFTGLLLVLTVLLCGLAPAIRGTRTQVGNELKDTGRGTAGGRGTLAMTRWLVSAQVGTSLLLLIGAGLFIQALDKLRTLDLGYSKDRLLLLRVDGLSAGVPKGRLREYFRELQESIAATPGVARVAWSENGLISGTDSADDVAVDGYTGETAGARWDQVGPGYFSVVGIPLRAGRDINERDLAGGPPVCVVNEAFVKKFIPDGKPLGKRVTNMFNEKDRPAYEIIGVSANAVVNQVRRAVSPRFYIPASQSPEGMPDSVYFEVRTAGEPKQLLNTLRQVIQRGNDAVQITRARTVEENLELTAAPERMIARLSAAFGAIALLLAALGLYGVLAYGVSRRANEIGVRMALGARAPTIVSMVLRESAVMIAFGAVAGLGAAAAAVRLAASQFYGVSGLQWTVVSAALFLLIAVALAAAAIPAWRASRIDPLVALRHD